MGAGLKDRVKKLFTTLLTAEATVGAVALVIVEFGLDGVLYSMPLSDLLTFLIALFLIIQTYREPRSVKIGRTVLSADRAKNYA